MLDERETTLKDVRKRRAAEPAPEEYVIA